MILKYLMLGFLLNGIYSCSMVQSKYSGDNLSKTELQALYNDAYRELRRTNYDESLELFKKYVETNKKNKNKKVKKQVFWAIDQISRIYLRVNKDTNGAIKYLDEISKTIKFSDAEEDDINEWLSVARDWKKLGRMPKNIKKPEELFSLGQKYFNQGMDKIDYPADDAGNADFYIASSYLIPYVFNYDTGKNIGKALFMLGKIRFRSWNDYEYWTENFYLKEVIRRFPHSKLAQRAYEVLEQEIHAGYTGSGGDNTPPSQLRLLKSFKQRAFVKKRPVKNKK